MNIKSTILNSSSAVRNILAEATKTSFSSRFMLADGIEKFPIPMFVIDHDHIIANWNIAITNMTGLTETEMIGTSNHWKAFYVSERPTLADLIIDGILEQEIDVNIFFKTCKLPTVPTGGMNEDDYWSFR